MIDDVDELVRRAAQAVPGGPPELLEIRRRRGHQRLRRGALGVAGVALLVVGVVTAPALLVHRPSGPPVAAPTGLTPAPNPTLPQRIFIEYAGTSWSFGGNENPGLPIPDEPDPSLPNYGFPPGAGGYFSPDGPLELTADGRLVQVPVGGAVQGFVPLPDGGFLTLLSGDHLAGGCPGDQIVYLRTQGSAIALDREFRLSCEYLGLAGVNATEAFLVRTPYDETDEYPTDHVPAGMRLVAYRLDDGTERLVAPLDGLGPAVQHINIDAAKIVYGSYEDCNLQVLDLSNGTVTPVDLSALLPTCFMLTRVTVSPDGRRLAVISYGSTRSSELEIETTVELSIVDLSAGVVLRHEIVDPGMTAEEREAMREAGTASYGESVAFPSGLGWTDEQTLRVAWLRLPDGLDHMVPFEDYLDVQSYAAP